MKRSLLFALGIMATMQSGQLFAQENSLWAINEKTVHEEAGASSGSGSNQNNYGGGLAPWFVRKYQVQGGLFMPFNNTNVRVTGNQGIIGTDIDFEKDLGFNKHSFSAYGAFKWQISRRSRINLSYFYLGRSATHTLERTVEFNDHTYTAQASVHAYFNANISRISYSYAILSRPKYEAGLMIGAHVLGMKVGMGLDASIGSIDYSTNYKLTAPLPDIGVFGGYAITDKLVVNVEASYLALTIGNINGHVLNYNLAIQYEVYRNLGISLSYTGLDFKVTDDGDNLNGYLKWGYNGPALTVTYSFGKGF